MASVERCGVWLFLVCVACGGEEPKAAPAERAPATAEPAAAAEPTEAAEPEAPPERTPAQAVMRGHFEQARQARRALVRADIDQARKAMAWLGEHPLGDTLPEDKRPLMAPMQAAARGFAQAKTLRDAGKSLAVTLTKCGACHQAGGEGPSFARPPVPEGDGAVAHMRRHHWAVDRMWEGLVSGEAEIFQVAFEALGKQPLAAAELKPPAEVAEKVEALTRHVHELGERARDAEDTQARAEAYGALLATCATCHRMLERGPKPLPEAERL